MNEGFSVEFKILKWKIKIMKTHIANVITNKESVAELKNDWDKEIPGKKRRYSMFLKEYNDFYQNGVLFKNIKGLS